MPLNLSDPPPLAAKGSPPEHVGGEACRSFYRRRALVIATAGLVVAGPVFAAPSPFAEIERRAKGRLGVCILDVSTGRRLGYRAEERFPMCSTFKFLLAGYVLAQVDAGRERLDRSVPYIAADLLDYAPTTRAHLGEGAMTVADLCVAAVQLSDNTAANLLLRETGGPAALTAWLRQIGDPVTRLDNSEPDLNVWAPGEVVSCVSPAAVLATWRKLLMGEVLTPASRARLTDWAGGATTGAARLHSGIPADWREGDKTGTWSGLAYGTANDIAIFWPPKGGPILVAAFLCQSTVPAAERDAALAGVGRVIAGAFGHG
jgi:beta-lactamase class A